MTRVLHVMGTDGLSGAERHLAGLVAGLRELGWASDVLVATRRPEAVGGFVDLLTEGGAGVRVLRHHADLSPALARAVAAAARSTRHDVVHSHLVHADWHAGLAGLLPHRARLVSTKHNHDPFRARWPFRPVEALWVRRSDATIAISQSLADYVARWHGGRPEVVHYGLPASPSPPAVPRSTAPPRRLLAVGRLEPQKGFDVLLDALSRLPQVAAVLQIVGDGSLRGALERQAAALGLTDRVTFLGRREDVPALMRSADLLVHPARWEGFGLVLLEAMDAGLPMVVTRVGAIPEVVGENASAVLVEPDDAAGLAAEVASVLDAPGRLAEMAAAGRARLVEQFDPRTTATRTAALYDRLTARAA